MTPSGGVHLWYRHSGEPSTNLRASQGLPIEVKDDTQTRPFIEAGRDIFTRRQGQLNLSCAQCHDDNWGQLLAGVPCIESAHPSPMSARNGFFGSRPFTRANQLLVDQGVEPVDWKLP